MYISVQYCTLLWRARSCAQALESADACTETTDKRLIHCSLYCRARTRPQALEGVDDAADFGVVCSALSDVGVGAEAQVRA